MESEQDLVIFCLAVTVGELFEDIDLTRNVTFGGGKNGASEVLNTRK